MKELIILGVKGFIMGIANIIPGVSGGTLAITLGIYEKLIGTISHFFKNIKENLKFVIPIGIGMVLSILVLSKVISFCLDKYALATILLFVGLILGGIPLIAKRVKSKISISNIIIFVLTFSLVIALALLKGEGSVSFDNMTLSSYLLLFVVIYCLQINFFTWFNIAGIMPNLYVVLVLFIGLFIGKKIGVVSGIIIGLILDALFGRDVGITSILLGAVGLAAEFLDRRYSKDSRITIIIMALVSTIFFEVAKYAICYFMHNVELEIMEFIRILLIENLFNTLLIIIVYAGMKRLGYYLEDGFKTKKFATRYF